MGESFSAPIPIRTEKRQPINVFFTKTFAAQQNNAILKHIESQFLQLFSKTYNKFADF